MEGPSPPAGFVPLLVADKSQKKMTKTKYRMHNMIISIKNALKSLSNGHTENRTSALR